MVPRIPRRPPTKPRNHTNFHPRPRPRPRLLDPTETLVAALATPHLLPATPLVDLHPFSALLFLTKRKNVAETMAFVDTAVQRVTLQTPVLTKKPPPTINQISFSPAYPTPSQQL